MVPAIHFDRVSLAFDEKVVLRDVSFTVLPGHTKIILGASGSGKSTLIHDVLYAAIKRAKGDWDRRVGAHRQLTGVRQQPRIVRLAERIQGRRPDRRNLVGQRSAQDFSHLRGGHSATCRDERRPHLRDRTLHRARQREQRR